MLHTAPLSRPADFLTSLCGWKRYFFAWLSGSLTALGLEPLNLWFIPFLTIPVFILLLDGSYRQQAVKSRLRVSIMIGWFFGFGYFVAGLWWLGNAMLVDPDAYAWAIPFASLGLPAFLALYWALAAFLCSCLWRSGPYRFFIFAACFGLCEWLRGHLFTGFPWNTPAYMAMPTPLSMQSAALITLYGMNILVLLCYASFLFFLIERTARTASIFATLLITLHLGFGLYRLNAIAPHNTVPILRARIIQPSIPQTDKIDIQTRVNTLEKLIGLSSQPPLDPSLPPDIIIWPETSVPYVLSYVEQVRHRIARMLTPEQIAIMGTVRLEQKDNKDHFYNSIELLGADGQIIAHADKRHLVPFGEYLPFGDLFRKLGLTAIAETDGGYEAGKMRHSVALPHKYQFLPLICYEAIFPDEMDYTGEKADFIINVTNDAWFGNTPGPAQHFQQARLRAVETGLPLIRAANNGISAVVDPYGQIIDSMPLDQIGIIDVDIPSATVPIWNNKYLNLPPFILISIFLIASIRNRRRTPLS